MPGRCALLLLLTVSLALTSGCAMSLVRRTGIRVESAVAVAAVQPGEGDSGWLDVEVRRSRLTPKFLFDSEEPHPETRRYYDARWLPATGVRIIPVTTLTRAQIEEAQPLHELLRDPKAGTLEPATPPRRSSRLADPPFHGWVYELHPGAPLVIPMEYHRLLHLGPGAATEETRPLLEHLAVLRPDLAIPAQAASHPIHGFAAEYGGRVYLITESLRPATDLRLPGERERSMGYHDRFIRYVEWDRAATVELHPMEESIRFRYWWHWPAQVMLIPAAGLDAAGLLLLGAFLFVASDQTGTSASLMF